MKNNNTFNCPSCNAEFEYTSENAGEKCQCCYCQHKFIVPPQKQPGTIQHKQTSKYATRNQKKQQIKRKHMRKPRTAALILIFISAIIASLYYLHNNKRSHAKNRGITLNDNYSANSEDKQSNNKQNKSETPRQILQPEKPSGIYSGFDTAGIETIVRSVEEEKEPWRQEAEKRIDKYRKTDIKVKVINALTGQPVKNAEVTFKLIQHSFRFGGIVNAGDLRKNEELYKKVFLAMGFNASGFNNALKYKLWRGGQKKNPEEIIEWLHSNDISVRGHCLIWPGISQGYSHMPKDLVALLEQYKENQSEKVEKEIRQYCFNMIKNWAEKWDVCEWDVINETRANHAIQDLLGKEIEADWFKTARKYAKNPNAKLYLNENRIISDPGRKQKVIKQEGKKKSVTFNYKNDVKSENIRKYYENVQELLKNGAPINALGFQSRFKKDLPPEMIYQRLSIFNDFGLPITATEFEMTSLIGEELAKAKLTEKVMTIYFSHKLVDGIYAWTLFPSSFKDAEGNEIINSDGTPNLRGKVWLYLTKNRWNTHVRVATDTQGTAAIRGFKGKYKITVKADDKEKTTEAAFKSSKNTLIIKI